MYFKDRKDVFLKNPKFYTSLYPKDYIGEKKRVPDGFDLIGFAIAKDTDESAKCMGFYFWRRPY